MLVAVAWISMHSHSFLAKADPVRSPFLSLGLRSTSGSSERGTIALARNAITIANANAEGATPKGAGPTDPDTSSDSDSDSEADSGAGCDFDSHFEATLFSYPLLDLLPSAALGRPAHALSEYAVHWDFLRPPRA